MEERNKQNHLSPAIYSRLLESEAELTQYLKYIRHKPQPSRSPASLSKHVTIPKQATKQKKPSGLVKPYIQEYLRLLKQAASLQSYSGRKIITRLIQYLEQFPTMGFLVEVVNSFGKEKKKLCLNEISILAHSNDEMIPLLQKIIERVEALKKQGQSKKLMQLGQRIAHLQKMVEGARKKVALPDSPLRVIEPQRVQKYLIMEENIDRAEKNFGKFSPNMHKNQQIFANINRVYQQISQDYEKE